jgi:hypothetical protein
MVMCFSRLVLFPIARGGRRHNRQSTGVILERLRCWNAGDFESLFEEFADDAHRRR